MKRFIFLIFIVLLAGCGEVTTHPQGTPTPTRIMKTQTSMGTTATPAATASDIATLSLPNQPMPTALPTLLPGQPISLSAVDMFDASNGWGIESTGRIVRTEDGAASWRDVTPPSGAYSRSGLFALDPNNAWALSKTGGVIHGQLSGPLWHTVDGGRSWQPNEAPFPGSLFIHYTPTKIEFIDSRVGWVLWDTGEDQTHSIFTHLERTVDGGKSWEETLMDDTFELYTGLIFLDQEVGYAGTRLAIDDLSYYMFTPTSHDYVEGKSVPELLKTTDGGKTWIVVQLPRLNPIPADLQEIESASDQMSCGVIALTFIPPTGILAEVDCRIFQYDPDSIPPLFRKERIKFGYISTDEGETWHSWVAGLKPEFSDPGGQDFIDPFTGWRLYSSVESQPSQLLHTADGGLTWTTIKSVTWKLAQFDFVDASTGWAIATDKDWNTALLYTGDGGITWQELKPLIVP